IVAFYGGVLQKLWALPSVQAAGVAETVPMSGAGESTAIDIPGYRRTDPGQPPFANYTIASAGYFSAVGTPLLRGREFTTSDTADSLPVAIVSRAMADRYWPRQDVIGKQVRIPIDRDPKIIVGVVADVKHQSLREDVSPEMYVPYTQKPWPSMQTMEVAVRTRTDPAALTASVRAAIQSLDPGLPLARVRTLTALVDDSMTQPRFALLLLASFAAIALLLAQIGMYGVVSYSVTQRTREIGIRMALGAPRQRVFAGVVAQAARLAAFGIAIGLLAALAVARLMAGFLYGVRPTSPLTFAAVSLLLVAVALLAAYLPARRASRLDPLIALRCE
ncbi:MAG TPA: FtsX-like permease family protein, partial [Rudaea sp.]|nr:FtsX-like permease family protein [Rudaea sp.]